MSWWCRERKFIMVIGDSRVYLVCNHRSDIHLIGWLGVWFVNHKYDCRQNWKTQSPVTNWSKLWQYLRKKLNISYTCRFSERKRKQQLTQWNARQQCAHMTHFVHLSWTCGNQEQIQWVAGQSTWTQDHQITSPAP